MFCVIFTKLLIFLYILQPEIVFSFEQTTSEPEYQPIEPCKTPTPPNNGTVSVWGNNMLVEFTCDIGLIPFGRTFGSCNPVTKRWSVKRPLCVSSACDPPANVTNGKLFYDHGGAIVIVACSRGFRLTGSRQRHCDGYTWRGRTPKCRDMYPSSSLRRQARDNVTTTSSPQAAAAEILEKHILIADNTCYLDYREPPMVEHATVAIIYKFNKARRLWIVIANYTCEKGYSFNDMSATYLYCQSYKWVGEKNPECINAELPAPDPCASNNGGCGHECVSHGGGSYSCHCRHGYVLGRLLKSCEDIDECRQDNGGCEQSCINIIGSYFCTCENGYISVGQKCLESTAFPTVAPLHQRSDIECYPDTLAIMLPDNLFPEQRNITWRENFCSVIHNGSHYISDILLTECGTTVLIENDTVTFSNELIVHKVADDNNFANDAEDRSITYGEDYETVIPVKCIYPRFNNVSTNYSPVKQNVRFVEKRFGTLDVAMEQYENDKFEKALDTSNIPRKVPLDDDVFVRVGLNFEPNDIRVKTDQCIATSAPSPADTNWRPLIQSGCPKDRVRLLSTGESSDVRFAFKAFDFRHNATGLIYIHCEVSVCGTDDASCKMGCASRAKRSASSRQKSHLVSTGPLLVERKEDNSKEVVTTPTVVAVVCVVVAMASVILAIVSWTRKPRHNSAEI